MTATGEREQHRAGVGAARVVVVGAGFGGLAAVRRFAGCVSAARSPG